MNKPRTLRVRLVLIVVALMAGVSIVVGVVSVALLQGYLVGQLDDSLAQSSARAQDFGPQGDSDAPGDAFYFAPGQASGTISGVIQDNVLLAAGYPDYDGVLQLLDGEQLERLAQITLDGRPHTLDLGPDLGDYRVIAGESRGGLVILTGLPLESVTAVIGQLTVVFVFVALLGLGLAAAVAYFIVGVALRPLNRVADTAMSVSELPLDRGDVDISMRVPNTDTTTEVGKVGSALNSLLGHVGSALAARQRSEDKVRRFVADASHELRTPLASIRGYSELTRRTQKDLPEEVTHSLGRIESEAIRMTTLVEELLLLARLDSQQELARDEVDLSRIVVEAVGDAHVAGGDHEWVVSLPEEPVVVIGDDPRLRQVLVNLLANARTHTPPGTTVTTTVENDGDEVVLRVIDDGPGIEPALASSLFERFTRGDESRTRATGSTGLGLSIVRAVAEAHGGTVTVASQPGSTVFEVRLPARPPAREPVSSRPEPTVEVPPV